MWLAEYHQISMTVWTNRQRANELDVNVDNYRCFWCDVFVWSW